MSDQTENSCEWLIRIFELPDGSFLLRRSLQLQCPLERSDRIVSEATRFVAIYPDPAQPDGFGVEYPADEAAVFAFYDEFHRLASLNGRKHFRCARALSPAMTERLDKHIDDKIARQRPDIQ